MKPVKRQQQIMERLRAVPQEWHVDDLARAMHVSALTIRRDLEVLEKEGAIVRTIGGCLAVWRIHHADYQARVAKNFNLKMAIGHAALSEVRPGDTLLINDGSTNYHLASRLDMVGALTVYTNSVALIGELRRFDNLRLYVLGGEYNPRFSFLAGALLQEGLKDLMADTVFMGADVIDRQGCCMTLDPETAHAARLMLCHARRKILLADHTKVSDASGVKYAGLKDFDLWITTSGVNAKVLSSFNKMTRIIAVPQNKRRY